MRARLTGVLVITFLVTAALLVVTARFLSRATDAFNGAARVEDVFHAVQAARRSEGEGPRAPAALSQAAWGLRVLERLPATGLPADVEARLVAAVGTYRDALEAAAAAGPGRPREQAWARAATDGEQAQEAAQAAVAAARHRVAAAATVVRRLTFGCLGALAVLAVLVAYFFVRRVMAPLRLVEEATKKIAAGDFTPLHPFRGRHEMAAFSAALDKTMQELESLWAKTRKCASLGALTRSLAEEVGTPVLHVSQAAETLREQDHTLTPDERRELYRRIEAEADRAERLVRNLQLLTGMRERPSAAFHLRETIETVVNLTRNHASIAGATLKVDVPEDLPLAYGDRLQLEQVFLNLVLNAIQAVPEGGHVTVRGRLEADAELLRIDVADNGVGIREEQLNKIFDPWDGARELQEGMPLGLALSLGIVRRHGGRIAVQSKYGLGSTFSVYLPVAPAEPEAADPPTSVALDG
jgi:two-component system NtrC family sensor kinase